MKVWKAAVLRAREEIADMQYLADAEHAGHAIAFFFSSRRRHTRWPRDWSSDVCSSDLALPPPRQAAQHPFALAPFAEPRIEPEIVFRLAAAPSPEMDEAALFGCIDWVAQGFEIVHSVFPGW